MTDDALRDFLAGFPPADACACDDPVPVSACCGAPMDGLYCTACHDHNATSCATCEKDIDNG